MKSLHIDTERTWRGGEQQLLYLLAGLAARALPAVLLAEPGSPLFERARAAGVDVRPFPIHGEADLRAAWRLARLLRHERFDVIHCHTAHAHGAALAARLFVPRAAMPKLVAARRVDFSIFRHSFLRLNRVKYRIPDRIVAVSDAVRDVLARDGVDRAKIAVVHDGIALERIEGAPPPRADVRGALGLAPSERLVLNVAHLAPHKGQRYLLEAIPAVRAARPDARFAIAGEGGLRADLEAQARALGLGPEALLFLGFRPPEEVPALLKAAHVFVFPSVEEGLGSSIFDAMAAGTPVVASRAGGIPEIVRDGETGLLVPPRDPEALARAIVRLLDDASLAARLAAAAREFVRAHGSAERMIEEMVGIYEELLSAARPSP